MSNIELLNDINCPKYKLQTTIYFDFDESIWTEEKPQGSIGKDYNMARKGLIFSAIAIEENLHGVLYTIELRNPKHAVYFQNLEDLNNSNWFRKAKENE